MQKRQGLLAHDQQDENGSEGEETRNLADRLLDADLPARISHFVDREVVEQVPPTGKAELVGRSHEHEQDKWGAPAAGACRTS